MSRADLVALRTELEALRTAFGNGIHVGAVAAMDPAKGYRLRLGGTDDEPYLSPWYPHPETGKTSVPLKLGQVVGVVNPSGDPRQGILIRGGYSEDNASPNQDLDANVFSDAGVTVTIANGALVIKAGGVTHTISPDGVTTTGGSVTHNDQNIGANHVHGGVVRGGADTFGPH